ncbi:HAD-like protein [Aureobasidium sp. EXF-10728]|nr:HAD-like protein [Aureobasidium sp. EXF-10728]
MQTDDRIANDMNDLSVQDQPKKKKKARWPKSKRREQAAIKSSLQDQHATFPSPLDNQRQQQEPHLVRYVPYGHAFPPSSYRNPAFLSINHAQHDYPPPAAPINFQPPTFQPINRHPSSFFTPSFQHNLPPPPPAQDQHFYPQPVPFFPQPRPQPDPTASQRPARQHARTPGPQPNTQQHIPGPEVQSPNPSVKRSRAIGKLLRPAPSLPYLMNSLVTSPKLDHPKSLLVVLDLNGVLAFRKKRSKAFKPRPFVGTFLDYLFANHHVMIWSSGMPENVERVMGHMLSDERQRNLVAMWSRDKLRLPDHLFSEKVQVYKQLSWIWEDPTLQMNAPLGGWSQRDTVLVDDSIDKAAAEPHNLVEVDEYTGTPAQDQNTTLLEVIDYLERIRWYENVSAEIRAAPFVAPKT